MNLAGARECCFSILVVFLPLFFSAEEEEVVEVKVIPIPRPKPENGVRILDREEIPPVPADAPKPTGDNRRYGDTGVPIGRIFAKRIDARAVHSPTIAGIHGDKNFGCFSISLNGGYAHDLDEGEQIVYTGHGGIGAGGHMEKDQHLTSGNISLIRSMERGSPVRVLRGYKVQSPYQPESGYRYDGLYDVVDWWPIRDKDGFKLYQYMLRRRADQAPLAAPRDDWTKLSEADRTWKSMPKGRDEPDHVVQQYVTKKRVRKKRKVTKRSPELIVSEDEEKFIVSDSEGEALDEGYEAARNAKKLPLATCTVCNGDTRFYTTPNGPGSETGVQHLFANADGEIERLPDDSHVPTCSYKKERPYYVHRSNRKKPLIQLQKCPCCETAFRLPEDALEMEEHLKAHLTSVWSEDLISVNVDNQTRIRNAMARLDE